MAAFAAGCQLAKPSVSTTGPVGRGSGAGARSRTAG